MTKTPEQTLAQRVLDQITDHPETWDQMVWIAWDQAVWTDEQGDRGYCYTTACVAGWTIVFGKGTTDTSGIDVEGEAARLLNLNPTQAEWLFCGSREEEDVKWALGKIIAGDDWDPWMGWEPRYRHRRELPALDIKMHGIYNDPGHQRCDVPEWFYGRLCSDTVYYRTWEAVRFELTHLLDEVAEALDIPREAVWTEGRSGGWLVVDIPNPTAAERETMGRIAEGIAEARELNSDGLDIVCDVIRSLWEEYREDIAERARAGALRCRVRPYLPAALIPPVPAMAKASD